MFSYFKQKKAQKEFEALLATIEFYPMKRIRYESVKSLQKLFHEVQLFVPHELVDKSIFLEKLKDIQVGVANSSNPTQLDTKDYFGNFVHKVMQKDTNKYVFHDVTKDKAASVLIPEMIPIPSFIPSRTIHDLRISRLYAGAKYSGTNIHHHSSALNYLVSGKKLWITFPFNKKNKSFIERNGMIYGQIQEPALDWLLKNYSKLIEKGEIKDLRFFIQNQGEVAYIPQGCYHAVVNLDDVMGITYSWPMQKMN